jgi:OOP family OmpA-OmpF porin
MQAFRWTSLVVMVPLALLVSCAQDVPDIKHFTRVQIDDLNDADGDGVINQRDLCGQTPRGAVIDAAGCGGWHKVASEQLYTIEFDLDKAELRPDQIDRVHAAVDDALANDAARILIVGDTSPEGSDEHNLQLAHKRAQALIDRMVARGIQASRIREFVSTDERVKQQLNSRERRTLVLIRHPSGLHSQTEWNIYQTENKLASSRTAGDQ